MQRLIDLDHEVPQHYSAHGCVFGLTARQLHVDQPFVRVKLYRQMGADLAFQTIYLWADAHVVYDGVLQAVQRIKDLKECYFTLYGFSNWRVESLLWAAYGTLVAVETPRPASYGEEG